MLKLGTKKSGVLYYIQMDMPGPQTETAIFVFGDNFKT